MTPPQTTAATRTDADLAPRLRFAITRTARRMRQEAGSDLGPSQTAALATIERHGPLSPSELAQRERIKRPTATRILGHLETRRPASSASATPTTAAASILSVTADGRALLRRMRARKTAYLAHQISELHPDEVAALERAADVLERMLRCEVTEALGRSFASLKIPNYRRYFVGQLASLSGNWMQMVAEIWVILTLTGSGVAVGLVTALQFVPMLFLGALGGLVADRVPKRRLLLLTQGLHAIPPLAMLALALTAGLAPWMVFALVFARGCVNAVDYPTRQAFVMEIVGGERVVNAVSLNSVLIHSARIVGPGDRGNPDRDRRPRALLRDQRRQLRGDDLRPRDDGPPRAAALRDRPARAARRPRRHRLRAAHPRALDPARADGRGRDARLQLPGGPAASRQVHLRGRARRLRGARQRDGRRRDRRRPDHGRPRQRQPGADRRSGDRLRRPRAARRRRADDRARARRAGPARRRQRDARRLGQLGPPARLGPRDAGTRDGALLDRLPRVDARSAPRSPATSRRRSTRARRW